MPSLVTGIVGGIQTRSAVGNAEKAQVEAALKAAGIVDAATKEVNPQILEAAMNAIAGMSSATQGAVTGVEDATTAANQRLDPYSQAGTASLAQLTQLLTNPGETKQFAFDPEADPGAAFRMAEGQKAIERRNAAMGRTFGGASLKELTRYAQGMAAQEYAAAYDRFDRDRAAERADKGLTLGTLSNVAGLGFNAARTAGDNTVGAATYGGNMQVRSAQYQGDTQQQAIAQTTGNTLRNAGYQAETQTDIGNAKAAGHMGRANAWNGMLTQIGKTGDAALAGGLGAPGKGFSLKGAVRGGAGQRYYF